MSFKYRKSASAVAAAFVACSFSGSLAFAYSTTYDYQCDVVVNGQSRTWIVNASTTEAAVQIVKDKVKRETPDAVVQANCTSR
jgi:hypothetical protein